MRLTNSFRVDRPAAEVFDAFSDIERVAACMPGARVVGRSAEDVYDGEVKVRVGPLAVAYSGKLHVLDTDREQWRLTMRAKGREQRGAGNADAYVVTRLSERDGATVVEIETDLDIRGKVAQFGRGVIAETSDGFLRTFAANLEEMLARGGVEAAEPAAAAAGAEDSAARPDATLDAWRLLIRPWLVRHAPSAVTVALSGAAAYLGARTGARHALRSGNRSGHRH
ncbi:SRPBCC family protein [Qaidamihabitans albus]|uniref:SRPBCC family protein n=1 Tax=Qaidamihabitans albus TaxID=2795733 RepID=UPI0018F126BB|nr:SRPBCC family protein [Qaidamihabitans albus]